MAKRFILLLITFILSQSSVLADKSYIIRYHEDVNSGALSLNSIDEAQKLVVDVKAEDISEFLEEISEDKRVLRIEENTRLYITWEPGEDNEDNTDSYYPEQWSLESTYNGIQMPEAWEISKSNRNIVVAVLDTGILPIDDFYNILPGADLISRTDIANDGDGRDMDPSDPGDWHSPGEFDNCNGRYENSSWHGSHVAGIIGAKGNNGKGIIGVAPEVSILPVRVIGKCGGDLDDIADGIRWAVGGKVAGLPVNKNPANVINMSLGAPGSCTSEFQDAINFAKSKGAVVVVSSGNSNYNLDDIPFNPASCFGVINTGSSDEFGTRSHFSNYGGQIDVMAPGGTGRYGKGILSFSNQGRTNPTTNTVDEKNGTSMSAPHVSGAAALIFAVNPGLFPDQVEEILKNSAEAISGKGTGSGLINVFEALRLAEITEPNGEFKSVEINPAPSYNKYNRYLKRTDEQGSGGSCGSISLEDGGGPGSGGKNAFAFTILMGMLLSRFFKKFTA